MVYCVAHKYGGDKRNLDRAKKITRYLQLQDLKNTYLCPIIALSYFRFGEIGYEDETELCLDLLSICDGLIVASDITAGVKKEIDFAERIGMEVVFFEG